MDSLKSIFDHYTEDTVKIDKSFAQKVWKWKTKFYSKNPDHVGFFTGYFFGYHIPKWTYSDSDYWLVDVMGIDEDEVASHAYKLDFVDKDHAVSSNILSIGLLYLIHKTTVSPTLDLKTKETLKSDLMEIMIARYITAIMNNYFSRGQTSLDIAQETYNRLSRRFVLKQEGSWAGFIRARAQSFLVGNQLGASARRKFATEEVYLQFDDEQVVKKLNAIKTNLNQAIKDINAVFREVLDDQNKISRTSSTQADGDDKFVRDIIRSEGVYLTHQNQLMLDKRAFINEDMLEVIESTMDAISTNIFRGALEWILDNQTNGRYKRDIETMRQDILLYGLELIKEEGIQTTNFVQIAYRLRQNFMSGKATDARLVKCRKLCDKFIVAYRPKSKGKIITLERVAILMYIVLRSLMM